MNFRSHSPKAFWLRCPNFLGLLFTSSLLFLGGCNQSDPGTSVANASEGTASEVSTTQETKNGFNKTPLNSQIKDFTLADYLGASHSLSDWKDRRATVLVFLGNECPLAKLYAQRLVEMSAKYEPLGVQFVGINSNRQDTLTEMAHYARVHKIEFPLLKDPDCRIADQFGATRTPEAYILDDQQTIRYWGRIDDQYGVGYSRGKTTSNEITNALDELLAGKPVTLAQTEAPGCLISRKQTIKPHGEVTYCNQIARIMQKNCIECHRDEQIAPFALANYDDVSAWSDTLLEVINDGRMPPWQANPNYGHFKNDARMSDEDKQTLATWIKNGLPEGDPANLPEPLEFAEGWRITEPDLIIKMPEVFDVPAKGTVEYKYFVVDPGFTEDKWVRASEARPGNRSIVHHLILFYIPPGQKTYKEEDALHNLITGYAPGTPAMSGPGNLALRIPAGSKLVFQMHYTPNGSPQTDQSEVGLIFADPKQVEKELMSEASLNFRFAIPPGAKNYEVKSWYPIKRDSFLYTLTPHMHFRGKSFRFVAHYPDQTKEILLDVPRYDFNWQLVYMLAEPKLMPAGSKLELIAHFDNSTDNMFNPDPTATVYWGDQTWQEMMLGTFQMSLADQDLRMGPPRIGKLEDDKHPVTFRYRPTEKIKTVHLVGSFNDWDQESDAFEGPDEEGVYTITANMPPGAQEYKLYINGKTWKGDPGNPKVSGFYQNNVVMVK